jgi:hypothetical protein
VSAAEALKAARAAGIRVGIDGDDLVLEASAPPEPALLDLLSRHKASIVTLLRPADEGWSVEDWHVFFDERAGIAEFDGGLLRGKAEARAFACCAVEWLNRNPMPSPPERVFGCGGGDHGHDPLLPLGIESTGHAWLHSCIWPASYVVRKAEVVAALAAMGIAPPADLPDDFGKNGANNGRLRIGTAERLWARCGGVLPLDRREPASQSGLSSAGLVGRMAMDA